MTMRTFHYAGVAEINVTLGLPRLIEIVDARKNPSTPMMTIFLEKEYAHDRDKARELAWKIEATYINVLGSMSTDIIEMKIIIELNKKALDQRNMTPEEVAKKINEELGVLGEINGDMLILMPGKPSYRELLQLVKSVHSVILKGIKGLKRVVIRKEDSGEYVLYTEGSMLKEVLSIEGVDATRTKTNNVNEIFEVMGIEAARQALINEATDTLKEQGLNVDVRHIMLVSDIMTVDGDVKPIGRHGISGEKASVLARAAFEVTVNHLLDSGMRGDVDELRGVTENVIVGQPIRLGTGNVKLIARKAK
jgi:DNA-directed RNA polymerase subunit A"